MKQEAQRRLDALSRELSLAKSASAASPAKSVVPLVSMKQGASVDDQLIVADQNQANKTVAVMENHALPITTAETITDQEKKKSAAKTAETKADAAAKRKHNSALLKKISNEDYLQSLDNTRWRIMLNIGREPGTWMPKTWGISGERLLMNLEIEMTPEALFDYDEFLNGRSGAKTLRAVGNQLTVAPTMKEGSRKVRVNNGGWRISLGEGPMGTDVLRFYFDIAEEVRHKGSDVYSPAGRVYCTCGFFPAPGHRREAISETSATSSKPLGISLKEEIRQEQMTLNAEYEKLTNEMEMDQSIVSWKKMMRTRELMNLRAEAKKLNERMTEARIREPERSILRLSRDQTVALTREGGVCCKVIKGGAVEYNEYHILGKFEAASMDNREHSDYRELLP